MKIKNTLDLGRELADKEPIPLAGVPGAFVYSDETPAHRFTTVVAPILNGKYCVVLPCRDFFDENLAAAVLAFVGNAGLSSRKPLTLLQGFCFEGYSFDTVAVLSPAAAKQYEHENDLLNKLAFVAFPIYRCELSGDESPDLIDLIRHDFLPSLDWKRKPCPKVLMAFRNTTTGARSKGSRPGLTTLQSVLAEIKNLGGSEPSWITIDNYAGRRCRVSWSQGHYLVTFGPEEATPVNTTALTNSVKKFLMHDQDEPATIQREN